MTTYFSVWTGPIAGFISKSNSERTDANKSMEILSCFAQELQFEHIAINVDPIDARSYFELKYIIRKCFYNTNVSVTIFLNKVMEVNEIEDINKILYNFHNTKMGENCSFDKMLLTIRRFYNWHNMTNDMKEYIKKCDICQKNKITRHTHQPLVISSVPLTCFATLFIDHVGPINPINQHGNLYILTCICDLSEYAITIPVPDTTAETTARNLVEKIFLIFGFPEKIISDNFTSFTSETLKEICKLLKIKQVFCSPYHPQSNVVERYHRTLGNYLRTFISETPMSWQEALPFATSSYKQMVHISTNYSPFELVFGRVMQPPSTIIRNYTPSPIIHIRQLPKRIKIKFTKNLAVGKKSTGKEKGG